MIYLNCSCLYEYVLRLYNNKYSRKTLFTKVVEGFFIEEVSFCVFIFFLVVWAKAGLLAQLLNSLVESNSISYFGDLLEMQCVWNP
jgi:hypothetical protein